MYKAGFVGETWLLRMPSQYNFMEQEKCFITGKVMGKNNMVQSVLLRKNLVDFIRKDFPALNEQSWLSKEALHAYRKKYLEHIIDNEMGELDKVEKQVVEAIESQELVAGSMVAMEDEPSSYGQRVADKVAAFGGSWTFIISFGTVLLLWIVFNSLFLLNKGFDPYPYILLNLILSCLAALQAPVIMMSQNRQEAKDRQRSEYDYKVNLKAELEIRLLHEKVDHLMLYQTQKILELQQMQMDYMEEIMESRKRS